MTIHTKHFYMRLNEWHHAYFGALIIILSCVFNLDGIFHIVGWFILLDDLIQHWLQGWFISEKGKAYEIVVIKGNFVFARSHTLVSKYVPRAKYKFALPHFLLHTLMYKYIKIQRFNIVNRITEYMNRLFEW